MASAAAASLLSFESPIIRRIPSFRVGGARSKFQHPKRRKKAPSIRLGGDGSRQQQQGGRRRGAFLVRAFRRIRLRWLRAYYSRALRRLMLFYSAALREMADAGRAIEGFQTRVMVESYGAVPIVPVSVVAIRPNYVQ